MPIIHNIQRLDCVESTNTEALRAREDGLFIIADAQTAGRGRHGRQWASAPGLGLWGSVCLHGPPQGLNFAAALAVVEGFADTVPLQLKWPNDVLHEGRKLCGILVEHRDGWNALGIGINVNHAADDFPPELQASATSLRIASGRAWMVEEALSLLVPALERRLAQWRNGEQEALFRAWADSCGIMGQTVQRGRVRGIIREIRPDGALIVDTADGPVVLTGSPEEEGA